MKQEEINQKVTDAVIANLEKCGSWRKLWNTFIELGYKNPSTGTKYSFLNCIYLLTQMAERDIDENSIDKTFMTFDQVSKIGAKVNKGAHAYNIFLYLPAYYDKNAKKYIQPKDYAKLTLEQKREIQVFPVLRTYNVFNTSDVTFKTAEDQAKYSFHDKLIQHETKTNDEIEKIFINYYKKENIRIHETTTSNSAYYAPATHEIVIPKVTQFEKQSHFYQVKAHETIHSTGKTLKRDMSGHFGADQKYSFEELVAELGSMMLLENFGMLDDDVQENSTSYIKSWCQFLKDNVDAIMKASTKAQKAAEYVLAE